jgi:hypothetical protein
VADAVLHARYRFIISHTMLLHYTMLHRCVNAEFNMVLNGGRVGLPKLEWKDGSTSVMTITDTGVAGDVHAVVSAVLLCYIIKQL